MNSNRIVYNPIISAAIAYARDNGLNNDLLSAILDRELSPQRTNNLQVTESQVENIYRHMVTAADDPFIGLRIGEKLRWSHFGIIGYIVLNSGGVIEGMQKYHAYYSLLSNVTNFDLRVNSREMIMCWKPVNNELRTHHRLIFEAIAASIGQLTFELTGKIYKPKEIHLCRPESEDRAAYQQTFDTKLFFNRSDTKIVFERVAPEVPSYCPNKEILQVLETHIREHAYKKQTQNHFSNKVLTVLKQWQGEIPGIDQVADRIGMNIRSLQMKLRAENTTFRRLRDGALCEESRLLLSTSPKSIEEISNLLGFSEPTVFYRAFKRWTGRAPSEYRNCR